MLKPVKRIVCCCSQGLGSSMILEINVRLTLKLMHRHDIEVVHCPLSQLFPTAFDLIIAGEDLKQPLARYPRVIILRDLIHTEELYEKLEPMINP